MSLEEILERLESALEYWEDNNDDLAHSIVGDPGFGPTHSALALRRSCFALNDYLESLTARELILLLDNTYYNSIASKLSFHNYTVPFFGELVDIERVDRIFSSDEFQKLWNMR